MQGSRRKIGILTGGGDCPGLNAAIRAIAKTAILNYNMEVIGVKDGFLGLIENRFMSVSYEDVSGILTLGGTILGASNKANPFRHPDFKGRFKDVSNAAIENYRAMGLGGLVCIGGDGTLNIAYKLYKKGVRLVGVPKTIDCDLKQTETTIGFDSALVTAAQAIDKLHTTAQSHHRVMVIEVMGRYAGWLALYSGLAGGGDIILLPEIPYNIKKVCEVVLKRNEKGRKFSIVVVSEGARPKNGKMVVKKIIKDSTDPVRLGGVGDKVARDIERITGLETRVTVLGHLQRGGEPTPFDRILATRLGTEACGLVAKRDFGKMVSLKGNCIITVGLKKAVGDIRRVNLKDPIIKTALSVGTSFGI
ncbi:MAG: 6-phosphofructokinase [Candidatus Omnitrophica bacterium CG02_land_8_20_14_3_00__42_8]|nr:MAG: 6-phosphofructokinase [Candidatus Omnitrophica bacterium CG02_land_8_20_14_3_00__42_8]